MPGPGDEVSGAVLTAQDLHAIDAYWRAANYCSVGQIYLLDNPLLREPLRAEHVKPRLMGHFGTTPGLNLIYAHLNRVIVARDLDMIYVIGPGHGGPGIVANSYLEGTYSEFYPHITQDEEGLRQLFRQFSFPGGIPSHVSPGTPGSIHEGGELGYSLMHAYGAAFDNPDLIVACVIGDGEAETAPLAGSWHSNKFLDPVGDGAVLPILHLNGYKIANPTILARIGDDELRWLLEGYGHRPIFVAGDDPFDVHEQLAAALDRALDEIADIQSTARSRTTSRSSGLAHDRLAHAKGLDGAQVRRRAAGRGHLPFPSGARRRRPRQSRASRPARRRGCVATGPRSSSTRLGVSFLSWLRSHRPAGAAWVRTPTPTAGSSSRTSPCRTSPTMRCPWNDRARPGWSRRGCSVNCCETSSPRIPRRSAWSDPTKPFRTVSGPYSRPPNASGRPTSIRPTSTSRPRAGSWRS